MIFETQQYQQDCIDNIIALLKNFDFDTHSVQSLRECFKAFYTQNPQPIQTLGERKNIDVLKVEKKILEEKTRLYLWMVIVVYTLESFFALTSSAMKV